MIDNIVLIMAAIFAATAMFVVIYGTINGGDAHLLAKYMQIVAICLVALAAAGCAGSEIRTYEDPRLAELDRDHEFMRKEAEVLQSRKDLLDVCKRVRHHEKWDSCYELAGLEGYRK